MSFVDLKNEPAEVPSSQRYLAGNEVRRAALAGGFYTHYGKRLLDITLVLLAAPAVFAVAAAVVAPGWG